MPTIKDSNNVVLFSDPVKLYLFKDDKTVKIAFKITDYVVTNREIHQTDFEHILENWKFDLVDEFLCFQLLKCDHR